MLAGYTTYKTRKSYKSITQVQALSFLSLSLNEKKSEACNHSIMHSVTFVLFGSRVCSIRWQGLRIIKYKMDSRPEIISRMSHMQICAQILGMQF